MEADQTAYRSALAMYEGEAQSRLTRMRAAAAEFEGKTAVQDADVASKMLQMGAADTVLTGGIKSMSLYERFFPKEMVGKRTGNTYDMPQISGGSTNIDDNLGQF